MTKTNQQYYWKVRGLLNLNAEQLGAISKLHRYATTLHRLDENSCNGHPMTKTEVRDGKVYCFNIEDTKWRERDEKKEAYIQANINRMAANYGWTIELQGDPRGWPMSLKIGTVDASILVNA